MANNKVVFGGTTLIDLTQATLRGSADSTKVLTGVSAFARDGSLVLGTMPNNNTQIGIISLKDQEISILEGYHNGLGTVSISSEERAKIINSNIKAGVAILGVTGKASVIDTETTQQEDPITSYDVREDYVGFVNGQKVIGAVPEGEVDYTPNETYVLVNKGIYDDDETIFVPVIEQNASTNIISVL